jgi:uncharacterized protein DUF4258
VLIRERTQIREPSLHRLINIFNADCARRLSQGKTALGAMKEIEIIPLARKKMARRGIPEAWVEAALTAPDQVVDGHGGRSVAQQRRKIRRREMLLRVVFEETKDKYVVITAYLTSDIRRYWRNETP